MPMIYVCRCLGQVTLGLESRQWVVGRVTGTNSVSPLLLLWGSLG